MIYQQYNTCLLREEDMEWAKPKYSQQEVNWAGRFLVSYDGSTEQEKEFFRAVEIIDNFRAAHAFPLNTLQHRLRVLVHPIDANAIVAQRLKRLFSIVNKLDRFPSMTLWQMQDIGGCRAVVSSVENVDSVVKAFKSSSIRHKIWHEDDYIRKPRKSGYRSRHLMYRYYSDKSEDFNELRIEVQIRTAMQHSWATTVETVDAFTKQALKSSSGRADWERFFQLMGTWMALREGTPPVSGTPTHKATLKKELRQCAEELQVEKTLRGFTTALRVTSKKPSRQGKADFYLLSLNNIKESLTITEFQRGNLKHAVDMYARVEKRIRDHKLTDAVLVSVNAVQDLKRAYPNYYADTFDFVKELGRILK
ncbi:GTP pyrophosphokinase family protein [Chloroflexota bacterium]